MDVQVALLLRRHAVVMLLIMMQSAHVIICSLLLPKSHLDRIHLRTISETDGTTGSLISDLYKLAEAYPYVAGL